MFNTVQSKNLGPDHPALLWTEAPKTASTSSVNSDGQVVFFLPEPSVCDACVAEEERGQKRKRELDEEGEEDEDDWMPDLS